MIDAVHLENQVQFGTRECAKVIAIRQNRVFALRCYLVRNLTIPGVFGKKTMQVLKIASHLQCCSRLMPFLGIERLVFLHDYRRIDNHCVLFSDFVKKDKTRKEEEGRITHRKA